MVCTVTRDNFAGFFVFVSTYKKHKKYLFTQIEGKLNLSNKKRRTCLSETVPERIGYF